MGFKDNVVCARLDDEHVARLDAVSEYMKRAKPDETWTRSLTIRYMIQRFHDSISKEQP